MNRQHPEMIDEITPCKLGTYTCFEAASVSWDYPWQIVPDFESLVMHTIDVRQGIRNESREVQAIICNVISMFGYFELPCLHFRGGVVLLIFPWNQSSIAAFEPDFWSSCCWQRLKPSMFIYSIVLYIAAHILLSFRGILSGEGYTACSVWRRKLGIGGRKPQVAWDVLLKSQPFAWRCS